ncbi:MAG: multiple resistance and pH regulation protein F [Candidatus Aegiribacteria sp.]|nr:multiple resistance and pH regulation protein F [Candidatus Aegiribacteria sp.]
MKLVRWISGTIVLLAIIILVIVLPFRSMFFSQDASHIGFVGRVVYILILSSVLILFRVLKGPTAADRIVAIDIFGILIVGLCAVLGIATGRSWYIDIGIAWGLQSFIGTLALAKYLEGRSFDD